MEKLNEEARREVIQYIAVKKMKKAIKTEAGELYDKMTEDIQRDPEWRCGHAEIQGHVEVELIITVEIYESTTPSTPYLD